jgi:hypothetical protein
VTYSGAQGAAFVPVSHTIRFIHVVRLRRGALINFAEYLGPCTHKCDFISASVRNRSNCCGQRIMAPGPFPNQARCAKKADLNRQHRFPSLLSPRNSLFGREWAQKRWGRGHCSRIIEPEAAYSRNFLYFRCYQELGAETGLVVHCLVSQLVPFLCGGFLADRVRPFSRRLADR